MATSTGFTDLALFRRVLRQVRPYWPRLLVILLLGLLAIPLTLLLPLPLKIAVDSVIGSHPLPGFLEGLLPAVVTRSETGVLLLAAGLALAIPLLGQLQGLASSLLTASTSERLVLNFRAQLFGHAQRLSLSYHDAKGTADSTYRIQSDAACLQYLTIDGLIPFVTAACTLAGMIYLIVRID